MHEGGRMRFGSGLLLVLVLLASSSCSDIDVSNAKSTTGRNPTVAEVPEADETVRGADDPAIVTLEVGSRLKERRMSRTEELPGGIVVPNTNLKSVPVTAALQAVLTGTDVSLSWESGTFEDRLVSVTNLSGPLPKVVEKICSSAKVFCSFRSGLLELKEKETFIIDLPSVPTKNSATGAATNTMADTISQLAGEKVHTDTQGGNLIYTTDVTGHEQVRLYLDQLRHGRPLVVLQLYIWEVALEKEHATGINWSSFSFPEFGGIKQKGLLDGLTNFTDVAGAGVSFGATLTGKVNAEGVLKFLSTQGQVQTISNPQLTFVSGSNADFKVGGKQRYISEVGSGSSSVSGSTTTTSSSTVSTDSLDTGLSVAVSGVYESGIISAVMELTMQDVISLNATTMENGTTVDLPETSERKVTTSLRVRPGDNLVLAGLVTSRDDNNRDGIPFFGKQINAFAKDSLKNTELVVLVKPSIVQFAESPEEEEPKKKSRSAKAASQIDAVVIDKDGAKPFKMPDAPAQPVPLQSASSLPTPKPELMVPAQAVGGGMPSLPAQPSGGDGSVVDKSLLQRGFSHAYDELQKPVYSYGRSYGGAQ